MERFYSLLGMVLNAFWHHGERRTIVETRTERMIAMCSAPSSITASGGRDRGA